MIYKILILGIYAWIAVYTVSYGVYEYKNKNPRAALGAALIIAALSVLVAGVMIKNYTI